MILHDKPGYWFLVWNPDLDPIFFFFFFEKGGSCLRNCCLGVCISHTQRLTRVIYVQ